MSIENPTTIYDFVEAEQKVYENPKGITLEEGWDWSMRAHLRRSFLYLNSQFEDDNENRDLRPNRNIILPIMNIQFRTEGFDVKDIDIYVDNPDNYFKSMLIRKFHQQWALKNEMDTFIDDVVVSYGTYGGVLVRNTDNIRPEVIDLKTLAFCDQTNILAYPFAIRHKFSPAELRKENKKWGSKEYGATIDVEDLIILSKKEDKREIEVFEVHGLMPKDWLNSDDDYEDIDDETEDVQQIQIVAFYQNENRERKGVTLFRHEEPKLPFKFLSRDKIEGRALGRGGVEELFEAQQWTNQNEIWVTEMLSSASKTVFKSDDPKLKNKNLDDVENNEVIEVQKESMFEQVDTFPRNIEKFNDAIERWQQQAQRLGSGPDPLMGETPNSGTPFKLYEAQQIEGKGMHTYRQGQIAAFMDEIYRDWVLPYLAKEIIKEQKFKDELSIDEMQEVVEKVVMKKTNQFKKNMILAMQPLNEDIITMYQDKVKEDIVKKGNKWFFKILKDEMKDISLAVRTNIAGKQKNMALMTDKLVNVLRQFIATPEIRQDPEMTKLLNVILESSGISPMTLSSSPVMQQPQMQMQQQGGGSSQPLKELGQSQVNK